MKVYRPLVRETGLILEQWKSSQLSQDSADGPETVATRMAEQTMWPQDTQELLQPEPSWLVTGVGLDAESCHRRRAQGNAGGGRTQRKNTGVAARTVTCNIH